MRATFVWTLIILSCTAKLLSRAAYGPEEEIDAEFALHKKGGVDKAADVTPPAGVSVNVALGKLASPSSNFTQSGDPTQLTNGLTQAPDNGYTWDVGTGASCAANYSVFATIDLGDMYSVLEVRVWQAAGQSYCSQRLELSATNSFRGEQVVAYYNSGFGSAASTSGTVFATNLAGTFRYVRFYSGRSTATTTIKILEVSVTGIESTTNNLALNRPITFSQTPSGGSSSAIVNSVTSGETVPTWALTDTACGSRVFATVDLGFVAVISSVQFWQTGGSSFCNAVELSATGSFSGEQKSIYNDASFQSSSASSLGLRVQNSVAYEAHRYVRVYTSCSTSPSQVGFFEIAVYGDPPVNVALNAFVSLSTSAIRNPPVGSTGQSAQSIVIKPVGRPRELVDGVTQPDFWSLCKTGSPPCREPNTWADPPSWNVTTMDCLTQVYATIDLGSLVQIYEIRVWQFYGLRRGYCNRKLSLSNTGSFSGEELVTYNPSPWYWDDESEAGTRVAINPGAFRYVRFYSSNNGDSPMVHMGEIAVYGTPTQNIALGKTITASGLYTASLCNLQSVVNGLTTQALCWLRKTTSPSCSDNTNYMFIDLGANYLISQSRVWFDTTCGPICGLKVELSPTAMFAGEQVVTYDTGSGYSPPITSQGIAVSGSLTGFYRYVKVAAAMSNCSNAYNSAMVNEIAVYGTRVDTLNLAFGKPVTLSAGAAGSAAALVDGLTSPSTWAIAPNWNADSCSTQVYATIDLQDLYHITQVRVWQYYGDPRQYCSQRLELSATGVFGGEQVVTYNTQIGNYGPPETFQGNVVAQFDRPTQLYQYVRFYSSKSNQNPGIHMAEIEVYGYAPTNVAFGQPVTLSTTVAPTGNATYLVDGTRRHIDYYPGPSWSTTSATDQAYATIDLGAPYASVIGIRLWQWWAPGYMIRKYSNQVLTLSAVGSFTGEELTVYSQSGWGPAESANGYLVTSIPSGTTFQYLKFKSSRNNVTTNIDMSEIEVYIDTHYDDGSNVALGKPVTLSAGADSSSVASTLVDGSSLPYYNSAVPKWQFTSQNCAVTAFATIDLQGLYRISMIKAWHNYVDSRYRYCGQRVELSVSGEFTGEQVVLDYTRGGWGSTVTSNGTVLASNVDGAYRYVRHHSSVNNLDNWVIMSEIAVYGVAVQNVAQSSLVTFSSNLVTPTGSASMVVDGSASNPAANGLFWNLGSIRCDAPVNITIDLLVQYSISEVRVWQTPGQIYCGQRLELSTTGEFAGEQTIPYNQPNFGAVATTSGASWATTLVGGFRFVRLYTGTSSTSQVASFAEVAVTGLPVNVAANKPVTLSPGWGGIASRVVDGLVGLQYQPVDAWWRIGSTSCSTQVYITIDLKAFYWIRQVRVWQVVGSARRFCNKRLDLSISGAFSGEQQTVFSTGGYDDVETLSGKVLYSNAAPASPFRYIRYYTSNSDIDDFVVVNEILVSGNLVDNLAAGKRASLSNFCVVNVNCNDAGLMLTDNNFGVYTNMVAPQECQTPAFFTVDLGSQSQIFQVQVWMGLYMSICGQKLELSATGAFAGEQFLAFDGGSGYGGVVTDRGQTLVTNPPGTYRYVRVSAAGTDRFHTVITLFEIAVFGVRVHEYNLARQGTVTLFSGYGQGGSPQAAVDSVTAPSTWAVAPNWNVGSILYQADLTVDLGALYHITRVRVWQYYGDIRQYYSQRVEFSTTGLFAGEQVAVYDTNFGLGPVETVNGNVVAQFDRPATLTRYVRYFSSRSTQNAGVHVAEIEIMGLDSSNVALGKPVTMECGSNVGSGVPALAVDGNSNYLQYWQPSYPPLFSPASTNDVCSITVDLQAPVSISAVQFWQLDSRPYRNKQIELSTSGLFAGEQVVVYTTPLGPNETDKGLLVQNLPTDRFRYVRFKSGPNTFDGKVYFLEVAVYKNPYATAAGDTCVSYGRPVTLSPGSSSSSVASKLVDGVTTPFYNSAVPKWLLPSQNCSNSVYATIDLQGLYRISVVKVWQDYADPTRRYCGQHLELSISGEFAGEQAVFPMSSGGWGQTESPAGHLATTSPGGMFRYVRFFSSVNNLDNWVTMSEIAVYGVAVQNIAYNKSVTFSSNMNPSGRPESIVDNVILRSSANPGVTWYPASQGCSELASFVIDLNGMYLIDEVWVWQDFRNDGQSYCKQRLDLSVTGKFNGEQVSVYSASLTPMSTASGRQLVHNPTGYYRYVRFTSGGSYSDISNDVDVDELIVLGSPVPNIAQGKPLQLSVSTGNPGFINDGRTDMTDVSSATIFSNLVTYAWMVIDLQDWYDVAEVRVWTYNGQKHLNVTLELSAWGNWTGEQIKPYYSGATAVGPTCTTAGVLMASAPQGSFRYVRYSTGAVPGTTYAAITEIQVYGIKTAAPRLAARPNKVDPDSNHMNAISTAVICGGAGKAIQTGLCYTNCRSGFTGIGPVCWEVCGSDYTDIGLSCSKGGGMYVRDTYTRGAGIFPTDCPSNSEDWGVACLDYCQSGYVKVLMVCVQTCPSGYTDLGLTCVRWSGLFDVDVHWKDSYDRKLREKICPSSYSDQDSLTRVCYTPCNSGYSGKGPMCYTSCASGYIDMGLTCAQPLSVYVKGSYGRGFGTIPGSTKYSIDGAAARVLASLPFSNVAKLLGIPIMVGSGKRYSFFGSYYSESGLAYGPNHEFGMYSSTCYGAADALEVTTTQSLSFEFGRELREFTDDTIVLGVSVTGKGGPTSIKAASKQIAKALAQENNPFGSPGEKEVEGIKGFGLFLKLATSTGIPVGVGFAKESVIGMQGIVARRIGAPVSVSGLYCQTEFQTLSDQISSYISNLVKSDEPSSTLSHLDSAPSTMSPANRGLYLGPNRKSDSTTLAQNRIFVSSLDEAIRTCEQLPNCRSFSYHNDKAQDGSISEVVMVQLHSDSIHVTEVEMDEPYAKDWYWYNVRSDKTESLAVSLIAVGVLVVSVVSIFAVRHVARRRRAQVHPLVQAN